MTPNPVESIDLAIKGIADQIVEDSDDCDDLLDTLSKLVDIRAKLTRVEPPLSIPYFPPTPYPVTPSQPYQPWYVTTTNETVSESSSV